MRTVVWRRGRSVNLCYSCAEEPEHGGRLEPQGAAEREKKKGLNCVIKISHHMPVKQ